MQSRILLTMFVVKLGRCEGSCNILNESSNNVCVPNKTEYFNLCVQFDFKNKCVEIINKAYIM